MENGIGDVERGLDGRESSPTLTAVCPDDSDDRVDSCLDQSTVVRLEVAVDGRVKEFLIRDPDLCRTLASSVTTSPASTRRPAAQVFASGGSVLGDQGVVRGMNASQRRTV